MAGTRDRLIHHYFGVNLDVVWGIVKMELPGVVTELEVILGEEKLNTKQDETSGSQKDNCYKAGGQFK